ncbi:MAG TPA: hypothetical protein VNU72_07110 [Puia sp.]|nr:hypothetical protein [Puia sp.]
MKESNFYSDEFEQLIREKTEQYKMYPSEQVWKGIHGSLHTKRKWFFGSMALLVTGILFLAGKELIAPSAHTNLSKKLAAVPGPSEGSVSKANPEAAPHSSFSTFRAAAVATLRHDSESGSDASSGDQPYKEISITISNPVISQPDLSEFLSHAVQLPKEVPSLPVTASRPGSGDGPTEREGTEGAAAANATDGIASKGSADGSMAREVVENLTARGSQDARAKVNRSGLAATRTGQEAILEKGRVSGSAGDAAKTSASAIAEAGDRQRINWLRDYAVYTLPNAPKRARTYLQLTLSPTVNFSSISGGDFELPKIVRQVGGNTPVLVNPSSYISHSPAVGFSMGGNILYRATRNLTFKGGLQFNFSQYKIRAYTTDAGGPQQANSNSYSSYLGYYVDSLTNTRFVQGSTQQILNNNFYQLSMPVGFELRVLGNERLQFNIGGSIQPTYLLNRDAYVLSENYQDYVKSPAAYRRWNLNAGMEAFLSYRTSSGIRWEVGPEFHYQLFSTYGSQYMIHENLRGYGIKFGITKIIP